MPCLGASYFQTGESSLGANNTRQAYALRERVSVREKLHIESNYYNFVAGDLEKANAIVRTLGADVSKRLDAIGYELRQTSILKLGQYDKITCGIARGSKPSNRRVGLIYPGVVYAYLSLNRLDEARATVEEVESEKSRFSRVLFQSLPSCLSKTAMRRGWSSR